MMKLFTSHWMDELTTTSVAIIRALVVSSRNGHIDAVRYLVQDMSADVNNLAHDKPVGPGLNMSHRRSISDDSEGQSQVSQEKPTAVPVISPLQAALQGFARLSSRRSRLFEIPFGLVNEPRMTTQPRHEEVIMFLLDSGSKLSDLGGQNIYPIQLAAKFCSCHIVEKFISAGTDVNANGDGESALIAATGRELSAASIVRRLLAVGATIPEEVEEQKELLEQALRYFRNTLRPKDADGQFLVAPSLEYVFNEGSGAVLFDLLHQMPQITTTDIGWTLILQMTAFLDDHPFLDLLLSRDTDINASGYYYGTALEAAARCGHTSMVQKLLDAGAEVNVLAGRWQTALRAALIGGHADVAEILLNHGADMNLGRSRQQLYINGSRKTSENALQLGVISDNLTTVETLLKHGANAVLDESETLHPLILASTQGNVAMVKELLNAGAPVNVHGKERHYYSSSQAGDASPIHAAIAGGYLDVTTLLLSHGADIKNNIEGVPTPLSVAASTGRADIVRLLLSVDANAIHGAALRCAVSEGSIEIAQELLSAGSKAESALDLACRRGRLPMIELLLEKIYDGEKPETVIDEAFAIHELDDSVFRLLLDYAPPTMRRFVQVCAAGSVASVGIMLDKGAIDINGQCEANGDYSLQVAASHLQAEVVRYLLSNGAEINCKSTKHGTPLMTALEACATSTLRGLTSENAKELVDKLSLPDSGGGMAHYYSYGDSAPSSFRQLSDCEEIVWLLVIHGANITDDSRAFGPPLHLACLLGSKALVELLLERGADLDATAGFFGKTIFAAIQGGHLDIVALLLQNAPLTKHNHPEYGTPLHLACAIGNGALVRKLLEHGANATVLDAKGRTPLTIALEEEKRQKGTAFEPSQIETPLDVILKLANPLHILDSDLVAAADVHRLSSILDIAKGMVISEAVICHVIKNRSSVDMKLLMQRSGGIGVTAKMLEAVVNHYDLEELLEHRPICRITPEILKSQKYLRCMKRLLNIDPEMPLTEGVIFRALEIANDSNRMLRWPREEGNDVLETLLDRSPDIAVTQEMLQAVRCAADLEILLKRVEPGTHISPDVIAAISKRELGETYLMKRPLLVIDALEMLLKHDPPMSVTEETFLRIFRMESVREKLADLMHKYGTRLMFTDKVREVIDHVYPSEREAANKKRFYNLRVTDENGIEPVDKSTNEETPGPSFEPSQSDISWQNLPDSLWERQLSDAFTM